MQNRKLIVIQGEQQAGLEQAKTLLRQFPQDQVISENMLIKSVLGKDYLAAIYNCYEGFDPDLLGAVGGTIIAGGVLILVTPILSDWPEYIDPFNQRIANWPYQAKDLKGYYLQRFVNKLEQADFVNIIDAESQVSELKLAEKISRSASFRTRDQAQAIQTILDKVNSNQPFAVVLEADRGRGKSAVLGMLIELLEKNNDKKIRVTAPSKKTVDVIFRHAGEQNQLSFIAPDQLCRTHPEADLLMIDEAAAIPASLLTQMLEYYPKIIFSTTVHGYEGTGRGFALRFKKQLDSIRPDWKKIRLEQPVRYAENDLLENFLFDGLLLDAKPVESSCLQGFNLQDCSFEILSSEQLINDESLLREVFGLLVLAHYQTRPTDLRHLLDGKSISVNVAKWQGHVIATALTVEEGGFDQALANDIHYGKRRPRGHLVPQSLAVHAGIADAPLFLTTRVMRIVVHPAVQKLGVASLLLNYIEQQSGADYLSSSFGATKGMLEFWNKQGFTAVRMGLSRDASSGSHSVIVIKPLTEQGKELFQKALEQFQRYFPVLLTEPLKDLEKDLLDGLLDKHTQHSDYLIDSSLTEQDQQDIDSFAYGHRAYENCMLALYKLVLISKQDQNIWKQLTDNEKELIEDKIFLTTSWQDLIKQLSLSGKKQALLIFRQTIVKLIS